MSTWHLVTGEYPPHVGGVSDFSFRLAGGLAAAGDEVHVWCPPGGGSTPWSPGVTVHREAGRFAASDLRRVDAGLDALPGHRRLLVQWVPHSYGRQSLNVGFCLWLWSRARRGDTLELVVHEPWLAFGRSLRQSAAAAIHRLMVTILLRRAARVWVVTPRWGELWRPYALGRSLPFLWAPLPNGIPVADPGSLPSALAGRRVVGHFGTYDRWVGGLLHRLLPGVLDGVDAPVALLIGRGSTGFRASLLRERPDLADRVLATGVQTGEEVSRSLSACDLLLQPYPDGVSTRRSALIAGLAHGVPVVTTDGESTERPWRESGAVALLPDDPEAWARRVGALLRDEAGRVALGERGRAFHDRWLTLDRAVERLRSGGSAAQDLPAAG